MNKEERLQQYIDKELSAQKEAEVEELLRTDPEARMMYTDLQDARNSAMELLEHLNPKQTLNIPPVPEISQRNRSLFRYWKVAAGIILLAGVAMSLWLLTRDSKTNRMSEQFADMKDTEILVDDLDYYISPNRAWNERKLTWTIIEIK